MSVSRMKKLTVLAHESDTDAVVRRLMRLGCVELRQVDGEEGLSPLDTAVYDRQRADTERRLAEIRRAIRVLSAYTRRRATLGRRVHRVSHDAFCADGRDAIAWRTAEDAVAVDRRRAELESERAEKKNLMRALEPWLGYDAPLDLEGSLKTEILLGSYPVGTDAEAARDALAQIGAYLEIVGEDEHGVYACVTILRSAHDACEEILTRGGFLKIAFPAVDTTARAAHDTAERRLGEIGAELAALEERLYDLAELLDEVEILCDVESTALTLLAQRRKLAATRHCTVITGWVPADEETRVNAALSKFECACEWREPEEGDEPPILLRNRGPASAFEWVIGMYAYPRYGAFDPTLLMSLFYFVIFGLMFADVGYGLVLVAACLGAIRLLRPREGMRRMLLMFAICGVSCMLMGVLFGGWFGDLPVAIMKAVGAPTDTALARFFSEGLWTNPIYDPITFLVVSLAVGAVHLITGMAVNFVTLCKKGQAGEAVCTIAPYWVLFLGFGLLALNPTVGLPVTLAGALLILCLNGYGQKKLTGRIVKGLGGLYGLINYAADLLSYCRILALGMVAGVVAQVINMITALGTKGIVGFLFMLIVLLLGHTLNLAINILGTFVHTARLQYIEFFGKFYEDGGQPFRPVTVSEEFSEEIAESESKIKSI